MSIGVPKPNEGALPWMALAEDYIQAVERRLSELVFSHVPAVFQISEHLLSAGGKRLRPALVSLSAGATGRPFDDERAVTVGAAAELVHMATLMHDDVIDQTGTRRGRATANSFWGNKLSVLTGDHMLSKAFWLLARDGDVGVMTTFAAMTVAMSECEVLQAVCEGDISGWKENYYDIVRGKTAGFFAACCRSGGIVAGCGEVVQDALFDYGMSLGIAFQITDDVLDVAGIPSATGKPLGSDLREGKFTLPLILTFDSAPADLREALQEILLRKEITEADIALVCDAAQRCGAVRKANETAADYAEKAIASLSVLPESRSRSSLESLARGIVGRTS
jgi:octaprenyl-diphosphate synthase